MAAIHGVGVLFSLNGQTISAVTGSFSIQDSDHTVKMENEKIPNSNGETMTKVYWDQTEEGTFTYVPTGTSGSVTINSVPIGSLMTVTDPNAPIAGSNWIVEEQSTKRTSTSAARVSLKVWRSPNITT